MCRGLTIPTTPAPGKHHRKVPSALRLLPTSVDEKTPSMSKTTVPSDSKTEIFRTTSPTIDLKETNIINYSSENDKDNNTKIQTKISAANTMKRRKQAFLARSMAHRTVSFVEEQVESMMASSRFLQGHHPRRDIVSLRREELQLGHRLGLGGSSEVYELNGLDIEEETDEDEHDFSDDDDDASFTFEETKDHPRSQDTLRRDLARFATQDHHHRRLVVKHLRQDLLADKSRRGFQTAAADLATEAEFLARLDHPHIIQLRGWTASGISALGDGAHDSYFMVLDRLDCTLADKIQEWKREADSKTCKTNASSTTTIPHLATKLRYARELASALEYLHGHRLVFRDLKPQNIGILNGSIVLFDFGLCRELPSSSSNTSAAQASTNKGDYMNDQYEMSGVGTLRYMAPEIMMHEAYNQKADTYSFAMVLYEMLFCTKPFELYSLDMFRMLVCDNEHGERPIIPPHCPQLLRDLLDDSWDHDPVDRPTFAHIGKDLQLQLDQTISSSTSTSASSGFWKPGLQFIWEAALSRPSQFCKSFSFASAASEHTHATFLEESSSTGS